MWELQVPSRSNQWIQTNVAQYEIEKLRLADEKVAEAQKRKRDERTERSRELQNALRLADADPNGLGDASFMKTAALVMIEQYESAGAKGIVAVVRYAAATKFLHLHTEFLNLCQQYRVQQGTSDKAPDMVKLALQPYGNKWPLVMPWVPWTEDNHRLVSSARLKEWVRTWLLVVHRGTTAGSEVSIPLTPELAKMVIQKLAATVIAEFTVKKPRRPDNF